MDKIIEDVRSAGQPVLILEICYRYDLGAEFYRWEFATAVAGAIPGIHPFNQPNVQQAKDATEHPLQDYAASGHLAVTQNEGPFAELLWRAERPHYLAIMANIRQTPGTGKALAELRHRVVERYGIATTLGYGPRSVHSTGQFHKGGPDKGLFLQITTGHERDKPIPGMPYTFGVIAAAQALDNFQALKSPGDVAADSLEQR